MLRNKCLLLIAIFPLSLSAQYFQYSQYNFTSQRVNPAMTGLTSYASASMDFRHQKTGGDFSINSNFLSLAYPFLRPSTGRSWSGLGISFHDDRAGGIFVTQEAAVAYAIQIPLSRWQVLSLGVKGLHQTRRVSYDGFFTGAQYVADRGFDRSIPSGESSVGLRKSLNTLSFGLYWQQVNRAGDLLGYFGASLFDFNKPDESFFDDGAKMSSTFTVNAGVSILNEGLLNILPEVLYTLSSSNSVANIGFRFQRKLRVTPNQYPDRIDLITKYVIGRSGIIGMQLHKENLSVGLSYDFPVFRRNQANLGALEVAVELRQLVQTKNQRNVSRRRRTTSRRSRPNGKQKISNSKLLENEPKGDRIESADETVLIDSTFQAVEITIPEEPTPVNTNAFAGNIEQQPILMEKIVLHFAFDFNSTDIDEPSEEFLIDLSKMLKEDNSLNINITGHTDNVGSEKFNLRLSLKRAETLKAFLLQNGISGDRILVEGKGMNEPLNENTNEAERARNRRVEIEVFQGNQN